MKFLIFVVGVIAVILKLTGVEPVADWSWWIVTAPFWVGFALTLVLIVVALVTAGISAGVAAGVMAAKGNTPSTTKPVTLRRVGK